jgi:acyl-coenzyme A thioesterase PaaI-like protein
VIDTDRIADLRSRYDACFGCGRGNPIGLHIDGFTLEEDGSVTAPFSPRTEYAGFADTLHGGIVATALDEISAWSAMISHDVLVFTATLDLRYRTQARTDASFVLHGAVTERRGRRLLISGRMIDGETVVAESRGLFVVADEHTRALADSG